MRCRVRRRRNFVALVSGTVLLIIYVSVTCIHVYVHISAAVQSANFTESLGGTAGFGNVTSGVFGKYFN